MPKILKPYTIIPLDLYVQRDADRQVKNIIHDMGRPGYVLVSRQMGKTNLLLNAKRKLETPDDVFVYVDLSNPFESAKSCFENIVDTAIETNLAKFDTVAKVIHDRRKELRDTPAHKQHTNELRLLINAIEGKLVIILDEIDALTKTQYSDQIFAQIRSIYFSRVNFKELEKLTYILSGVIEPNEIIKDPKISPFNIGQKIFLNDFNRDEFEQFITNSKLSLRQEIRDRIFYWTSGNPRMTWDVCSEVENRLKTEDLTSDAIDKIVNQIYLTTFDKPPIDNIRELVSKDREIRNSIVEIEYKKGKEVSDKIKNKLYLSGIVNYDENDIHIKNEIIKQSLNLEWIKSLEEEDRGLLRVALDYFEKEEYKEAVSVFERFLSENDFDEEDKSLYYHYMGIGYLKLNQPEKAVDYFTKTTFDKDDQAKLFYRTINFKGTAYFNLGKIEESLGCLKIIINSGRNDIEYARALINYGITCLKSSEGAHHQEAISIFKGIIDETGIKKGKLKESFLNELKSIAHLNLGRIQNIYGDIENAITNYKEAIQLAKPSTKPSIILSLLEIINSENEKQQLLSELIDLIIEGKTKPIENDIENPMDFSFDELKNIVISAYLNYNDTLFSKLKPHLSLLGEKSISKHLYDLALFAMDKNKDWLTAKKLLEGVYQNFNSEENKTDKETKYTTLKLLAYFTRTQETISAHVEYITQFTKERLTTVDNLDMEIFANLIYTLSERKKYNEALKYVDIINSIKPSVPDSNLINYILIYHLELNIYFFLNNRTKAIQKAKEIILLASDEKVKQQTSNLLGETGLAVIRQNAESILHPTARIQTPIKSAKIYSRNQVVKVRYKDGTTLETKFKKVENDLNTGVCFILN